MKVALPVLAATSGAALLLWLLKRRQETQKAAKEAESATPQWVQSLDLQTIDQARETCRIPKAELLEMLGHKEDYECVLDALARNIKMGPFTATSGLVLEYLLNAATSLLDHTVAHVVTRMTLDVLQTRFCPGRGESTVLVVGGEVGGGVMVGQCAAAASLSHPDVAAGFDFAYMRKKKKSSGTLQQLEAPPHITSRTPTSTEMQAVWLDEANSTGSEMLKNIQLLKKDYNITVVGTIFLVDRSRDRANLKLKMLRMANPALKDVTMLALYDLEEIDDRVHSHAGGEPEVPRRLQREVSDIKEE